MGALPYNQSYISIGTMYGFGDYALQNMIPSDRNKLSLSRIALNEMALSPHVHSEVFKKSYSNILIGFLFSGKINLSLSLCLKVITTISVAYDF